MTTASIRSITRDRLLLVGVDGSPGSVQALRWALREARLHGGRVRVVLAWHRHGDGSGAGSLATRLADAERCGAAYDTLSDILASVRSEGVTLSSAVVPGLASEVLIEVSSDADLLVVGSLGVDADQRVVLGSVSRRCALLAQCPVVVIPAGWRAPTDALTSAATNNRRLPELVGLTPR